MTLPLSMTEGTQLLLGGHWLAGLILASGAFLALKRRRGNLLQKRLSGAVVMVALAMFAALGLSYLSFGLDFVAEQLLLFLIPAVGLALLLHAFYFWAYRS